MAQKFNLPVISIGNLTLGGSAKSPTTIFIASLLKEMGRRPAIISRGYHGSLEGQVAAVSDGSQLLLTSQQAGDEPVMIARRLPDVPVVIGASRVEAAAYCIENFDVDCLVLDDAFQHLPIARDLDILCVNGQLGFGNHRIFPSGPLREPLAAAASTGLCLVNSYGGFDDSIADALSSAGYSGAVLEIPYRIDGFYTLEKQGEYSPTAPQGTAFPVASVANPEAFVDALETLGLKTGKGRFFPDHYRYEPGDLKALDVLAKGGGFAYYVTTEKDAVKLADSAFAPSLPVYVARVSPRPSDNDLLIVKSVLQGVL